MSQNKTALVLSAGGMFGAWQAGAWKVLASHMRPEVVVGASAGALNAWIIAGGASPDELIRHWSDPEVERCARIRLAQAPWRGIFDARPLEQRIRNLCERYRPRTEIGVVATELRRLKARLFRNGEIGWKHLAASCAVLMCYPQPRIDGRLYSDGGLLSALPVWAAAEMGATRILALNALPIMPSRTVRLVVGAIRACGPRSLPRLGADVQVLAPSGALGTLREALFWNGAAIRRWIAQGEADACAALSRGIFSGRD